MATFGFKKSVDDIEEPELLSEDWYAFEIAKEPEILMNRALAAEVGEGASDDEIDQALRENDKCGYNLVVSLMCISDDPLANGRRFKLYIPYPSDYDEDRYDGIGQKVYDAKLQRIAEFAEAFQGDVDGGEITMLPGGKGQAYVIVQEGQRGQMNSVDLFSGFKPLD